MSIFNNLKSKYLRWKAKRNLRKRYEYLLEVNKLMEEFDMERILGHDETFRRNDLSKVRDEYKNMEVMLEFLKRIKL